jgi:adenosylcobinamide-GDP ribazoletransferase
MRSLLLALQFLTRVPVTVEGRVDETDMGRAAGYFPLVGLLLGLWYALFYELARNFVPHSTAAWMVLVVAALTTGGFHEDGLADAVDGFGGGWTRERKLEIMRDSRIGSYGGIALVLLMLAKYDLMSHVGEQHLAAWMVFASTAGRWAILPVCLWLPYARAEGGQGEKVAHRIGIPELVRGTLTLILATCWLPHGAAVLAWLVTVSVAAWSGLYCNKQLGGITGDCLGATEMLTEVALYALGVAMLYVEGLL